MQNKRLAYSLILGLMLVLLTGCGNKIGKDDVTYNWVHFEDRLVADKSNGTSGNSKLQITLLKDGRFYMRSDYYTTAEGDTTNEGHDFIYVTGNYTLDGNKVTGQAKWAAVIGESKGHGESYGHEELAHPEKLKMTMRLDEKQQVIVMKSTLTNDKDFDSKKKVEEDDGQRVKPVAGQRIGSPKKAYKARWGRIMKKFNGVF
jgi:hypothetical protein